MTLTPRQRAILSTVEAYYATYGYSPTLKEIADRLGGLSTSHVAYSLDRLQELGYLTRHPLKARTIVLTHKEPA
jgi:repressor LexA